ncbi:uracil phosphoribosyltransferase [Persephonella sp.]
MKNVINVKHPLLEHLVTVLRDINTPPDRFRKTISQIGKTLFTEALREEKTKNKKVSTWVGEGYFPSLEEESYVFIPILRAGLPMLDGLLEIMPSAVSGFLAVKRNEETLESRVYYDRVPDLKGKTAVVLDPMVATGGSLNTALSIIKEKNPEKVISINIIGAPEGLENVSKSHPDVKIFIAQIDEKLNDKGFIIPGLGDAGDRAYNT